jgi:hypothetical protein
MISCWINERAVLSQGQIIEIRRGIRERNNAIRVTIFYDQVHRSVFTSWDNSVTMSHPPQQFNPVIIGMVTDVDSRDNRTSFNLRQIRGGLPPFNTDGGPLTKTFISSRIDGLRDERLQSALGICEAGSQPVYWEGFPPESRPAQEVMIDRLNECHVYIGIFGSVYSEPTIIEYRRAEELGRSRLCFVKNVDDREKRLMDFLHEIRDNVVYRNFTSSGELKILVSDAVIHSIEGLFE